jgi:hypothetical protein
MNFKKEYQLDKVNIKKQIQEKLLQLEKQKQEELVKLKNKKNYNPWAAVIGFNYNLLTF